MVNGQNYCFEFEGLTKVGEGAEAYSSLSRLEELADVAVEHSAAAIAVEAVESPAVGHSQAWEGPVAQIVDHLSPLPVVLAGRKRKGLLLWAAVADPLVVELALVAASVGAETETFDPAGYLCSALDLAVGAATTGTTRPLIQSTRAEPERWAQGLIRSGKAVAILSMASHPKWHRHQSLDGLCLAALVQTPKR